MCSRCAHWGDSHSIVDSETTQVYSLRGRNQIFRRGLITTTARLCVVSLKRLFFGERKFFVSLRLRTVHSRHAKKKRRKPTKIKKSHGKFLSILKNFCCCVIDNRCWLLFFVGVSLDVSFALWRVADVNKLFVQHKWIKISNGTRGITIEVRVENCVIYCVNLNMLCVQGRRTRAGDSVGAEKDERWKGRKRWTRRGLRSTSVSKSAASDIVSDFVPSRRHLTMIFVEIPKRSRICWRDVWAREF